MSVIVRLRARYLEASLRRPILLSLGPMTARRMVVVELETDDGCTGLGESWVNHPAWAAEERMITIQRGLAPLVLGRDPERLEETVQGVRSTLIPLGRQWGGLGPIMQSISALDIALWDLLGRMRGLPISELLGGSLRPTIPVYASGLGTDSNDLVNDLERCAAGGFDAFKIKVGFGCSIDVQALRTARALRPVATLCADANQAWSLREAIGISSRLKDVDLAWLEEPIAGNRLADLIEFNRETGHSVATGENLYGARNFRRFTLSPHVAVLQPDVTKMGGFSELKTISAIAAVHDQVLISHCFGGPLAMAATLQAASAFAAIQMIEYDVADHPLRDRIVRYLPQPKDGAISIPTKPGLGIDLDYRALEQFERARVDVSLADL